MPRLRVCRKSTEKGGEKYAQAVCAAHGQVVFFLALVWTVHARDRSQADTIQEYEGSCVFLRTGSAGGRLSDWTTHSTQGEGAMKFDAISAQLLLLTSNTALTLQMLAVVFAVHPRTIERWLIEENFPAALAHKPGARRHWDPAAVLAWVREREAIANTTCNIRVVCQRTKYSRAQWNRLVKAKDAPAPIARELGSGQDLWAIQDIDDFLERTRSGLTIPGKATPPRLRDGRRGPRKLKTRGTSWAAPAIAIALARRQGEPT